MAKIDALFEVLIERKGSDLHLEQGQKPKIRLNGAMENVDEYSILTDEAMKSILPEITTRTNWAKLEETGDLDFAYAYGTKARFRANYFKQAFGYGAIFRIIPSKIMTLAELEMPDTLKKFADIKSGLVLVTGPTGSGKSTTLSGIIDHINTNSSRKIVTIEEPVEFTHPTKKSIIVHREVGLDAPSFSSGLTNILKSDADVILVGEMRDPETIGLALKAAEMGILVFGTLHTNSAAKTIDRIIDVFPAAKKNQARTSLANTIQGVVSQQLLRSSDGKRRYAAIEILLRSPAVPSIIRAGESMRLTSEIQLSGDMGMMLMDDCLMQLVKDGKVAKEEAHLKAVDKSKFL
jgi:twitching motility protein PilT